MSALLLIVSVLLGFLLVLYLKPKAHFMGIFLAFSGSYLLSVTVLHLIPEIYIHAKNTRLIGILILAGLLLQSVLESFSKGTEHGHIFHSSQKNNFPWLLFASLCIHAFTEGLPIHKHNNYHHNLLWAVFVHKIPVAIVLTSYFIKLSYSKKTIFFLLLLFALMSPLGMIASDKTSLIINYQNEITALTIGVLLHISTIILFESSDKHKFNLKKFIAILSGMLLTIFTL